MFQTVSSESQCPPACIHFYLCLCAFLSSAKLTSEFHNVIQHSLKCTCFVGFHIVAMCKLNVKRMTVRGATLLLFLTDISAACFSVQRSRLEVNKYRSNVHLDLV